MNGERDVTRTLPFWLIFIASALGGITNSASTPIIPAYVEDVLGGGSTLAGFVIAIAAVSSMVAQPAAGALADRQGYRVVAATAGLIAVIGMSILALIPTLWGAGLSRILFGLGNSAAMGLVMTWLVAITPSSQRGKALSYFGLSVWIGLAVGPQVGTAVDAVGGPVWVFAVCAALEVATVLTILALPRPRMAPPSATTGAIVLPRGAGRQALSALRSVWSAGIVAAAAWSGEGLMIAFLIVHLGSAGVPAVGLGGAATVYAVFAVSVVGARLVLARLPDRIGPLRATAVSLSALTVGLTVLALSQSFWAASAGAVLIGVGFSPLYPSLTMLATRGLTSQNRAFGMGLFSSFTSIGYGGGALLGGAVIAVASSTFAFLIVAALQLVALAVLVAFTRDDSPRVRADRDEPRDPAA
ncbi:MFS transporter [Microbacterium sp. SORGH_AS_0888]|uniref:MFS transporter n=1 Tax=Microbacterium sp. SORGH_AS_0888 TaxID=3041791 RepID=UPI00278A51FF|nr:MFS transporter [Microbacterium sp. SORGH_AS_0888]MDQ1129289.1 MFS family permease [Microbacterium sp. SORGH_AS_0888]